MCLLFTLPKKDEGLSFMFTLSGRSIFTEPNEAEAFITVSCVKNASRRSSVSSPKDAEASAP